MLCSSRNSPLTVTSEVAGQSWVVSVRMVLGEGGVIHAA